MGNYNCTNAIIRLEIGVAEMLPLKPVNLIVYCLTQKILNGLIMKIKLQDKQLYLKGINKDNSYVLTTNKMEALEVKGEEAVKIIDNLVGFEIDI